MIWTVNLCLINIYISEEYLFLKDKFRNFLNKISMCRSTICIIRSGMPRIDVFRGKNQKKDRILFEVLIFLRFLQRRNSDLILHQEAQEMIWLMNLCLINIFFFYYNFVRGRYFSIHWNSQLPTSSIGVLYYDSIGSMFLLGVTPVF